MSMGYKNNVGALEDLLNNCELDDELPRKIGELGLELLDKYEVEGHLIDLDSSIQAFEKLLQILPSSDFNIQPALGNLAISLAKRFERVGRLEDLEEAIVIQRELLSLRKQDTSMDNICSVLSNLSCSIKTRHELLGQQKDLDEAISLLQESIYMMPGNATSTRYYAYNNLAGALLSRFYQSKHNEDLEESIALFEEALTMAPPGHPNRGVSLSNVALVLKERGESIYQSEDRDQYISLAQEALVPLPPRHENRSGLLNNLGLSLKSRFHQFGNMEDLEASIIALEEALSLDPQGHYHRSISLNNLAIALSQRCVLLGQSEDMDTIVTLHEEALSLRPLGHSDRSTSLRNLSESLSLRYDKHQKNVDLDRAIIYQEEALSLQLPGDEGRIFSLCDLSHLLEQRFHQAENKELSYLDEAILLQEEALAHSSGMTNNERCAMLSNLGTRLITRYQYGGNKDDLDRAIYLTSEAASSITRKDWNKSGALFNLACALQKRFEHFRRKEDSDAAIDLYMEVSKAKRYTPIHTVFSATQGWAKLAHETSHFTALHAYETAIELLYPLASLSYDVHSRQQILNSVADGFASDAAYCAIQHEQFDIAVEILETGRSVFWSQALQTRAEIQTLAQYFPALEKRLAEISQALETASYRSNNIQTLNDTEAALSKSRDALALIKLNEERLEILEEVRNISGFGDFLKPLRYNNLRDASERGTIVILNATQFGSCDALIMNPTSEHVHRHHFTDVTKLGLEFIIFLIQLARKCGHRGVDVTQISTTFGSTQIHLGDTGGRSSSRSYRFGQKAMDYCQFDAEINFPSTLDAVLEWLWKTVVHPILQLLNIKKGDNNLPRLWWYPTGLFTALPLHAAGIYSSGNSQECISDYVVSSYTSTITALLGKRDAMPKHETSRSDFKMLVVADTASLSETSKELDNIKHHIPASHLTTFGVAGEKHALVKEVSSHLSSASIVHFACHGRQMPKQPLHSYLQLTQGEHLEISTIMQLPMPTASIAFLSACETAVGDDKLPDESLHIGASLIFAGFKSVVATMWEIDDEDGPIVADAFYEYLFRGVDFSSKSVDDFDPSRSAEALHYAISILRSYDVPPYRWVPFIHIGR